MKGFIKVSQNSTAIVLSDGSEIECKQSFEDLEKLVYNALVL